MKSRTYKVVPDGGVISNQITTFSEHVDAKTNSILKDEPLPIEDNFDVFFTALGEWNLLLENQFNREQQLVNSYLSH